LRFGKDLPKHDVKVVLVLYERATLSNSGKDSQTIKFEIAYKIPCYIRMSEVWKPITKYENYSVSTLGSIKNNTTQRILRCYVRNGYKSVSLSKDNVKKTVNIHTVVAQAFLEKPQGKNYVVNHINEDKLDNRLENLEYTTYRENTMHSMTSKRTTNTAEFNLSEFVDIPNYVNYMVSKKGDVYSKSIKRLCCATVLPNGYRKIKLKADSGQYKDLYIHVIVAIAYLNYIPSTNLIVVNHKDGKKGNNSLENLEVITHKENMKHSVCINNDSIYRRAVYYIKDDGTEVHYKSAKEASQHTGIDNSSILKSCKSDTAKAGKFKWHYMSNS
jgi:HNH endonuclease/NUMOD4 motif